MKRLAIWMVTLLAGLGMVHLAMGNSAFGTLSWRVGDEWGYYVILAQMWAGLKAGVLKDVFAFGFYNYGFGFFAVPMVLTAPFQEMGWDAMTILVPRLLSIGCCLAVVVALMRRHWFWGLALLTMPAIWRLSIQFKPEWWMVAGLVLSVQWLSQEKTFNRGVVAFSVTVALTKIQAITWVLYPLGILALPLLSDRSREGVVRQAKAAGKFLVILIGIFIGLNPYSLHPLGAQAFLRRLKENILSNATNHGLLENLAAWDKVEQVLAADYLGLALFILFMMMLVTVLIKSRKTHPEQSLLVVVVLVNLAYLLWGVNKAWSTYYLPVVVLGIWSLSGFFKSESLQLKKHLLIVLLCLNVAGHVTPFMTLYQSYHGPETSSHYQVITEALAGLVGPDTQILTSYPFTWDYRALGLHHHQIHTIVGPLSEKHLHLTGYRQYWFDQGVMAPPRPFVEKNIVVLDKRSLFFDEAKIQLRRDSLGYQSSVDLIKHLKEGAWGYQVYFEDEHVLILIQPVSLDRVAGLAVY